MNAARWLAAAALLAVVACAAPAGTTIQLETDAAGGADRTATDRELLLVLPDRFFRPRGETGFSKPYIAELYYSTDEGGSWESYALFKDLGEPFEFTAEEEGRYGFFITLVDRRGNADMIPDSGTEPQISVLVDWTPPNVDLLAPQGGEIVGGEGELDVEWIANDLHLAGLPVKVEYSADGSKSWETAAADLENSGTCAWKPPKGFVGRLLFRVVVSDEVGHETVKVSPGAVLVGTVAPKVALKGPSLASSGEVPLEVDADDGEGSGVSELELWSSVDGGASWSPAGSAPAAGELTFSATSGKYGLFVVALDRAGNASPRPQPGDPPQLALKINTEMPLVRLETLNLGGIVAGGGSLPIQWEATAPQPAPSPVSIYFSPDGGNTWKTVAADIRNSGHHTWNVPAINSSRCLLKVTVRDSSGAVGEAVSARPFTVDSGAPTSAIGVRPSEVSGRVGDLSQVLRPLEAGAGPQAPDEGEKPSEKEAQEGAREGAAAAGAEQPSAGAPGEAAAEVPKAPAGGIEGGQEVERPFAPEPTEPPDEAWKDAGREESERAPGPDADFEEVLKAGFAAYKAGHLSLAKEYFLRAAKLNENDPRPHAALGRIYARTAGFNYTSKKESFEAAIYEFEKALELSGGDPDVLNDMGFAFLRSGRNKDAVEALRKATERGSKPVYYYNLGFALHRRGEAGGAEEALLKAVELAGGMKEAAFLLARIFSERGHWEEAKEYWQAAADGYGPESDLGRAALSGLQEARERLGEVEPEKDGLTLREKLDRIR